MIYNKNGAGYRDPTAGEALRNIARDEQRAAQHRPALTPATVAYIASPYSGDVEVNVARAKVYSRFAMRKGVIPFTPHLLYPQFLDDTNVAERARGLAFGLVILARCDELWAFGGKVSAGMAAEIAEAKRLKKKIRYFDEKCEEVKSYA